MRPVPIIAVSDLAQREDSQVCKTKKGLHNSPASHQNHGAGRRNPAVLASDSAEIRGQLNLRVYPGIRGKHSRPLNQLFISPATTLLAALLIDARNLFVSEA